MDAASLSLSLPLTLSRSLSSLSHYSLPPFSLSQQAKDRIQAIAEGNRFLQHRQVSIHLSIQLPHSLPPPLPPYPPPPKPRRRLSLFPNLSPNLSPALPFFSVSVSPASVSLSPPHHRPTTARSGRSRTGWSQRGGCAPRLSCASFRSRFRWGPGADARTHPGCCHILRRRLSSAPDAPIAHPREVIRVPHCHESPPRSASGAGQCLLQSLRQGTGVTRVSQVKTARLGTLGGAVLWVWGGGACGRGAGGGIGAGGAGAGGDGHWAGRSDDQADQEPYGSSLCADGAFGTKAADFSPSTLRATAGAGACEHRAPSPP